MFFYWFRLFSFNFVAFLKFSGNPEIRDDVITPSYDVMTYLGIFGRTLYPPSLIVIAFILGEVIEAKKKKKKKKKKPV